MSETEYNFREYTEGDESNIVSLLNIAFRKWPSLDLNCEPVDHWRWKYYANENKPQCLILCEKKEGLIGCAHTVPLRIKIDKQIVNCGYGADFAVQKEYRNKGIAGKLTRYHYDSWKNVGLTLFIAATRNPRLIKSSVINDIMQKFPINVSHLGRIKDVNKHLKVVNSKNIAVKSIGLKLYSSLNKLTSLNLQENKIRNLKIKECQTFDERFNDFWGAIKDDYIFIVQRNMDYLNWRYCDSRAGEFIIKTAEIDGSILGYIILRINSFNSEYPRGFIVDLLTLPRHYEVARLLIKDALAFFDANNINIVNSWVIKNHPHEKILRKFGFVNIGLSPFLFHVPLKLDLSEIVSNEDPSRMHITYGDMDWI